ncbi:MAG: hypothetical protein ACRD2L_17070 [Terriglobia bacterium]
MEEGRLNPPMVMPIALTPNLLHDYIPLVWAGGGHFLSLGSNKADLTSDAALAVPLKLMERAAQPSEQQSRHRIIAFPEMSHEEAVQHFLNGEYLALIEPVGFIKRWKDMIARNGLPKSFFQNQQNHPGPVSVNFWDYAGVAAPTRTFIGGSDLIVMSRVKETPEERDAAFKLVRFLESAGAADAQQPQIEVQVVEEGKTTALRIVSPRPISKEQADNISAEPSPSLSITTKGIPLIRDLLWYGFGVKASCQTAPNGPTILSIPLQLTRSNSK